MLEKLQEIIGLIEGGFAPLRVAVIGDVMIDRYLWGDTERISPEAPVPVVNHTRRSARPGAAANVALNLARLGLQVQLAGFWGDDSDRMELESLVRADHIDTSGMVIARHPTISKTRILSRNQQMLRLDVESGLPYAAGEQEALLRNAVEMAGSADAVILSDYAKGALSAELCAAVIAAARKRRIPVLVDPKTQDFGKYRGATTVCPNLRELRMAARLEECGVEDLLTAGQKLIGEYGLEYLTVTMSEHGIALLHSDTHRSFPARAREVYDVSGAGDTVIATLAACAAAKLDVETAVQVANAAAAVAVGKIGTSPVECEDLLREMTEHAGASTTTKVMAIAALERHIRQWHANGETVVFTNGCFDILHAGHVMLLETARSLGDRLIVAVNTDRSVRGLKGEGRPVNNEQARARVMAALAAVHAVVLFDEETPLKLIRQLRPDVLVKGGDYSEATIVGAAEVKSWGGRVVVVPTVEGHSTTGTIERMAAVRSR